MTAHHHSSFCSLTISNERQPSEVEKPFPLLSPIFHLTIMIIMIIIRISFRIMMKTEYIAYLVGQARDAVSTSTVLGP